MILQQINKFCHGFTLFTGSVNYTAYLQFLIESNFSNKAPTIFFFTEAGNVYY